MVEVSNRAWIREAKVTIGDPNARLGGRFFSNIGVESARKIQFRIKNNLGEKPNGSIIKLYNLSPSNRAFIEGELTRHEIILEVGYSYGAGLTEIFRGDIYRATSTKKGAVWITKIESGDGQAAYRDGFITVSAGPGTSYLQLLRQCSDAMSLPLDTSAADLAELGTSILNGSSFHGTAHEFIRRICRTTGHEWSIQLGIVQILVEGGANHDIPAVALNPNTGLLGTPAPTKSPIRYESTRSSRHRGSRRSRTNEQQGGINIHSLLNPEIYPGSLVELRSSVASGIFVAKDVTHRGDTIGDTWETKASLFELGE